VYENSAVNSKELEESLLGTLFNRSKSSKSPLNHAKIIGSPKSRDSLNVEPRDEGDNENS